MDRPKNSPNPKQQAQQPQSWFLLHIKTPPAKSMQRVFSVIPVYLPSITALHSARTADKMGTQVWEP